MPCQPKLRMPAIVSQNENAHLIPHDPEKKMVAENSQPSATDVIPEKTIPRGIGSDAVLGGLHLREQPIA